MQKNSSTDTEYSMQPYKVVKQSSNETSTSLTGSFNVDQTSTGGAMGIEPSLDHSLDMNDSSGHNQTVIENQAFIKANHGDSEQAVGGANAEEHSPPRIDSKDTPPPPTGPPRPLKKQFSVDQGMKITVEHGGVHLLSAVHEGLAPPLLTQTVTPCASPLSRGFHYLRESSSTSTEEFKEDHGQAPSTSGGVDSKATKLDQKPDDENDADNRFSETMC